MMIPLFQPLWEEFSVVGIDILNYLKRIYSFSYTYIAYKIMLNSGKCCFCPIYFLKLKLIKSYLWLTIFQQRLNESSLLFIEVFL